MDSRAAVLFDVDGTLVDTNYLHTVAWWRALRDQGAQVAMTSIHPLVGMGSDQLVRRLLGHDSADASAGHARRYEAFKEEIHAFPHAAQVIGEVARRGAAVVLVTSSDRRDVPRLRDAIGAGDAVDHVVSKGDVAASKPAPDAFAVAVDRLDLDPARTLVVGDTVWDVEAAAKVGLDCIGVLTGDTNPDQPAGTAARTRREAALEKRH